MIIYSKPDIFHFVLTTILPYSCRKEEADRFPLSNQYNIDSEKPTRAFEEFKTIEGALSLIVCREGTIVAEEYTNYNNYGVESFKNVMSVTKTFTGVLAEQAIDKGFIAGVNDPISKYLTGIVTFPDCIKANITIDQPLSVIITQATGKNTLDFAREYLSNPLGINKLRWPKDDIGFPNDAADLQILTTDIVRFGNMILNNGNNNGIEADPESWINEITITKISANNDVSYGPEYGYQIWPGTNEGHMYYMAMGWSGQFMIIIPGLQLVVTATCWTSGLNWQQAGEQWTGIIQIIFEKILPCVN